MNQKAINHSELKKTILILAFVINIAGLLLISFLWKWWIYLAICGVAFVVFSVFIVGNKFIYNKFITIITYSALPLFGVCMYAFGKRSNRFIHSRRVYQDLEYRGIDEEFDGDTIFKNFDKSNPNYSKLVKFFYNYYDAPLFDNSVTKFLSDGSTYFDELCNELKQAKNYILLQSYVIKEGSVWDKIFEILKEKARQGLEIKILYDPLGCKTAFSDKLTFKKLENYKIECLSYKTSLFGYENHRKLAVIDGVVAFVGNANISNSYIDLQDVDNCWEVSGIKITGDAVWRMAISFFNDWQFSNGKLTGDFINYRPEKMPKLKAIEYVQPVAISPITNSDQLKKFWLNIISNAHLSLDIVSSYINIDDDIVNALKIACKSGVKVSIITSSLTDRKANFAISRDQYRALMRDGVNIVEYSGFVRSKLVVIDNEIAIMGSPALDTRWLNQKFENVVIINGKDSLRQITKNVENIKYKGKAMTFKELKDRPLTQKSMGVINRLFRFKI